MGHVHVRAGRGRHPHPVESTRNLQAAQVCLRLDKTWDEPTALRRFEPGFQERVRHASADGDAGDLSLQRDGKDGGCRRAIPPRANHRVVSAGNRDRAIILPARPRGHRPGWVGAAGRTESPPHIRVAVRQERRPGFANSLDTAPCLARERPRRAVQGPADRCRGQSLSCRAGDGRRVPPCQLVGDGKAGGAGKVLVLSGRGKFQGPAERHHGGRR